MIWRCGLVFLAILWLAGCARDSEGNLRARLGNWFLVEETLYFKSASRCTAAMFRVPEKPVLRSLAVQSEPAHAKAAFQAGRVAAIRMPGYSPNDLTDAMLLEGQGTFGKEALRAGARAVDCLRGTLTEGYLHVALTRDGALLAYDRDSQGLIVVDLVKRRLFYVAGDV